MKGKITIESPIHFAMIRIGFNDIETFDQHKSRGILQINGNIFFKDKASIGHGSKLSVHGDIVFGNNFLITAETSIISAKKIVFGDNCLISWKNLIMDTDFHKIIDTTGKGTNPNKEIIIGNNVWIGCRCTILKDTIISDNTVIATNSCLHGKIGNGNQIIGGNPARVLKDNIKWEVNLN